MVENSPDEISIKGANKRGVARLAAVQALYQLDLSRAHTEEVIAEYETFRIGQELDGETYREGDKSWFRGIVNGVVAEQRELDPLINKALPGDWPLSRIDTLLRALLRAGVFELMKRRDVPAAVVINEYMDVANAFFEEEESRLTNGVLDQIARQLRQGELSTKQVGESGD